MADTLQDGGGALATGQRERRRDALLAALGDDVRGEGSSAESSPTGAGTRVPSAAGRSGCATPWSAGSTWTFEGMDLASSPGLHLNVCTAAAGTPTADALTLLASWAASQEQRALVGPSGRTSRRPAPHLAWMMARC